MQTERKLKLVNGQWAYVSEVTYKPEPVKRNNRSDYKEKGLSELFGVKKD